MRYIDKVIKKLFNDGILQIEKNLACEEIILEYYEDSLNQEYIYSKKIKDELFFLISASKAGIGLYIPKDCLFYIFESLSNSEYYKELTSVYTMKKDLKCNFYSNMSDKIMLCTLENCNSKDFYLKEKIRASNCINF